MTMQNAHLEWYNAHLEWDARSVDDDKLIDALVDYHPATSRSGRGRVCADFTIPAESLHQAAVSALAIADAAVRLLNSAPVLNLEVLPTAEFDQRYELEPMPERVRGCRERHPLDSAPHESIT